MSTRRPRTAAHEAKLKASRRARQLRELGIARALLAEADPWPADRVVRLADLTPDAARAIGGLHPSEYPPSVVPHRCGNPSCAHWCPDGSRAAGRCLVCQTPLVS